MKENEIKVLDIESKFAATLTKKENSFLVIKGQTKVHLSKSEAISLAKAILED